MINGIDLSRIDFHSFHMGNPQGEWKVGIGRSDPRKGSKITVDRQTGKVLKHE